MFMSAGILLAVVFSVFFVLCIVVGCISYWAQFGILISPESVTPKFDKLNPINGLKQLFSKKKLIELLMSVAKASIIGLIIYLLVKSELPTIISLSGGEPKDVFFGFFEMVKSVFHVILVLCLILAVIDFGMQKYFHIKGLMMDKEEIKREYKESEGDPLIKGKRKQLAMQWAMSGPAAKTKDANAVVVNPTHFAVALLYDPEVAGVPIVLTKGKDEVAHTIIKSAKDAGIPVIRHVWLARTLYATCRDDTVVPRSSYEAVAYVFAVVNELIEMNATDREIELEAHGDPPEAYQ
jgi:type III secretion protein U